MFDLKSRILVLDDKPAMRKLVIKNLKDLGFTEVQEAADGILGWHVLEASKPPVDLVISDGDMPNCGGLDLVRKIRAAPAFAKLPFILLTEEAEASQVKAALMVGVTDYILKPFAPGTLKTKLEQTYKKMAR